MYRTQKYRLYPTPEQAEKLTEFCSVVRFVYNLALEQRIHFHRQYRRATGKSLNFASQGRQLTELRAEFDWIAAAPSNSLHGALQDLDKAFGNFFRGGGFPRFRKAGVDESFEIKAADARVRSINSKWSQTLVPKIGWVKFRDSRVIRGAIRSVRIVQQQGKWFACIGVRSEYERPENNLPAVGIDRGVTLALVTSEGEAILAPKRLADLERLARREQRSLSRRKRGSARYTKQCKRLASIKAQAARIRADWQHKSTTAIVSDFGKVVIEDLKTRNMTARAHEKGVAQKRGLNRAILNIGGVIPSHT